MEYIGIGIVIAVAIAVSCYAKFLSLVCYILDFVDFCNFLHSSSPPFVSVYTSL